MTVKTATSWSGTFVTVDSTGALTAATGTPVGVLYVDGVANGASVTVTGAQPYKWTLTLPSLTAGQRVDVYITATVSGVASGGIVASDAADTSYPSETYARIGATGSGLTSLAATGEAATAVATLNDLSAAQVNAECDTAISDAGLSTYDGSDTAGTTTLLSRLTSERAGYLDNLSAGAVATAAKLLAYVKSLARSDFAEDADIGGTFDAASDSLQAIRDRGDAAWTTGGGGDGAIAFVYTVTRSDNGAPLQGVLVQAASDEAGDNVVAEGTTNALGKVTLNLDAGTYYFFRRLSGYVFDDPDTETVSAS